MLDGGQTNESLRTPALPAEAQHFAAASSDMLAAILDQSLDCIKLIGPGGQLDFMNRNGLCAMEIEDFALIAGRNWWDMWPEESAHLVRDAVERARRGHSHRFEAYCPTAKGTPRWWEVSVSPLMGDEDELRGIISVSRDVTDRVRARELRETAAAEMRHRLQNAYALVSAMVHATAKGSPERVAFGQEIAIRLERLGAAQALLMQSDEVASLDSLIKRLTEPFSAQCELRIGHLPDVLLREDDVRVVALALGELSTNSNKYGALGHGGSVSVDAVISDGVLELRWVERFSAMPEALNSGGSGSGHRLVQRALAAQGGAFELQWVDGGLDVRIRLPHRMFEDGPQHPKGLRV